MFRFCTEHSIEEKVRRGSSACLAHPGSYSILLHMVACVVEAPPAESLHLDRTPRQQ